MDSLSKSISCFLRQYMDIFNSIDFEKYISSLTIFDDIKSIIKDIDFQKIEDGYKTQMKRILLCGFYPARYIRRLTITEIADARTDKELVSVLSNQIAKNMDYYKKDLIDLFPKYKNIIDEVYDLYKKKKYRLCILSLINICSLIFNKTFTNTDPFDKKMTPKKLRETNVMKENENRYMIFIPIIDNDSNIIAKSFQDNPEEYKKYSFNRNAIIHGYSDNYDNELNCLRWFSVLYNTLDIIEEYLNNEK